MYEPIYIPQISNTLLPLAGVRFGITHSKERKSPDDPGVDLLHIHDCTELYFHIEGKASFMINGDLIPLSRWDVVIVHPNEVHMCVLEQSAEYEHYCLWLDLSEEPSLLSFLQNSSASPILSFANAVGEQIEDLLRRLQETEDPLERTASLLQLILHLQKKSVPQRSESSVPTELRDILEDINENFPTLHSISELCTAHFVSPATLNRWFRSYLQITPHDYIESRRLSYAAKLLSEGRGVSEACLASGFSDCSHFIRLFRRKFGATPLQFKRGEK